MAREKKKSRTKKQLLPQDVLEGRLKVDPLELYRLIHRVNPTNRRLSRPAAQRRYDEKHKLQSFLVLHFGEEHVVVSRSEKEGVVRFDHPSGILDACHAPLAELEPEARSWIQRRLDMEGGGEDDVLRLPDSGDGAHEAPPEDLLSTARRSLAEFDYTNAERLLRQAIDAGEGGVEAVVELLALQVETLGLDEEALNLRPRLHGAAGDDVDVRSLLALAAARQGHLELAEKLVTGLGDSGAATSQKRRTAAYAALAAGAVGAGDEAAARRWLAELVDCDPFYEAVATVRAGLERLAEAGMQEVEAELAELYRERGCLEAAAAARTLADRWPGSEVARRILREAGELRRETAIAEHLEIADRALTEEDFDTAVRHYEAVLAEDADVPDIPRRLEQARRGAREQAEASAVGGVERRFAEGGLRRALLAYLELPEALRGRLRSRLQEKDVRSAVDDLDAVDSAHPRLKAPAAAAAVLALREAEGLFAQDRVDEAYAALGPHQEILAAVARTSALRQEIVQRLMEERVERNHERVRQVEDSFKGEGAVAIREPEKILELIAEIDADYLTPEYRLWLEAAEASMRRAIELHGLAESYKRDLKAGDLFAARQNVRQYRELATRLLPASMAKTWKSPGQFLDAEIKRAWQLKHESWRLGKKLAPYPGILQPRPRPGQEWRSENRWLDDEGRRLVVAHAFVDWLFVRILDVRSGKLLERLSMNTPKPLGAPLTTCWDGEKIRIGGADGGFVVLETKGWKIAEWEWLPKHLGKEKVERSVVLPRSPYVWVFSREPGDSDSKVRVLEHDAWRVMRKRSRVLASSVLYGLRPEASEEASPEPEPRFLLAGKSGSFLCAARGHLDPEEPLVARHVLAAAADGTGIVALVSPPDGDGETSVGPPAAKSAGLAKGAGLGLARFEPGPDGWRRTREVLVASGVTTCRPAMVAARGMVWTLVDATDGETWMIAFLAESLEPLYSLRVPHVSALAGDRHGRHAALLLDGELGPEVVYLGRDEPRLRWQWRPLVERRLPIVDLHMRCVSQAVKALEGGREAVERWADLPPSERRRLLLGMARESSEESLKGMILQAYALHDDDAVLAREFLAALARRHPENLDVVFLLGEWKCRVASASESLEDWKEALQMVLGIDPDWVTVCLRHFHHVQGVGYLLAGDFDKACQSFEAGLAHKDADCDLKPLLELAKPMKGEPPKASAWNVKQPVARQLIGALRTAGAAFRRDDDKAVVAALERPAVWLAAETETLIRLALAHIELTDDPAEASFEARLALSFLLEVIKVKGPRRIPSADLRTAAESLKEAEDAVRKWLAIVAETEAEHLKETGEKVKQLEASGA